LKGIKTCWDQAIAGTGICPICHRAEKPWHVPANCPLLKELNLKLVSGPPSLALGPASLAVQKRRALQQGDCKNAFCQGILPPDKITIVCPPSGHPDADPHEYWLLLKTLYGLLRSPRHWYDQINAILISIGLTPSLKDPCLYSGLLVSTRSTLTTLVTLVSILSYL
jgi:hypothetical protein